MSLGKLVLGTALALSIGAAAQAEELTLTAEQMDRVTASGRVGDRMRAAFARLALAELEDGRAGGVRGQASSGINVLVEYVKLEILIKQNGY